MQLQINGHPRTFEDLPATPSLAHLIESLGLKSDRIAVERNGEIAPRTLWPTTLIASGDRIEIVHFVGGGL